MVVHLLKLCVGAPDIQSLADWQALRLEQIGRVFHVTRMVPKRRDEIVGQGSLYWVMRGMIAVRQKIVDIEQFKDAEGIGRCRLVFDPKLVPVRPAPRRAFQGWRYLEDSDAPPDLPRSGSLSSIPEEMRAELAELGLL